MPHVAGQRFPYTQRGQAAAAQARRRKKVPPRTPPGVTANPAKPTFGAPVQKSVTPLGGGAPKSTLPRRGTVGFLGKGGKMRNFDPELVERLRKRLGKQAKGQGAYNLLHTKGKPSDALSKLREAQNRKSKFGGPDDGRKATRKRKRASFGSASSV